MTDWTPCGFCDRSAAELAEDDICLTVRGNAAICVDCAAEVVNIGNRWRAYLKAKGHWPVSAEVLENFERKHLKVIK